MSDLRTKIDVLDLIIQVLQDHEKTLDEAIARLEALVNHLESVEQKGKSKSI